MLKHYDSSHNFIQYISNYKDYCIESDLNTADKTLTFTYLGKCSDIPNESYIETEDDIFVVKEIHPDEDGTSYTCQLDLEDFERSIIPLFQAENVPLLETAQAALADSGWSVQTNITRERSVRVYYKTPRAILEKLRDAWMCEIRYDTKTKTVYFEDEFGDDKGVYFIPGLNLGKPDVTLDSYEYYTRIRPSGADGLTIKSVNDGVDYLENYQYSNKVKTLYWEDTNYTDPQALKDDAEKYLEDLSKPKRSYSAEVTDLAKCRQGGDYDDFKFELGDTIHLIYEMYGINEKQRIVKMKLYPDEPGRNSVELSNTAITFEELQDRLNKAADAWETLSNSDGSIKGIYVHGVQVDDVVGIVVEINTQIDSNQTVQNAVSVANGAASTASDASLAAQTASQAASTALTNANSAVAAAGEAWNKADSAQTAATNAGISAGQAAAAASAAQASASNALTAATSAQNSLKSVVVGAATVEKAVSVMQTALEAIVDYDPDNDITEEYFWHDANGAHVLGTSGDYRNDIDSAGMKIIETASEKSVAEFGADVSRVGAENGAHILTTSERLQGQDADGNSTFEISSNGERESIRKGFSYEWQLEVPGGGTQVSGEIDVTDILSSMNVVPDSNVRLRYKTNDRQIGLYFGFFYGRSYEREWSPSGTDLTIRIVADGYGKINITASSSSNVSDVLKIDRIIPLVSAIAPNFVFGSGEADGAYAFAVGRETQALSDDQTVVGKYNEPDVEDKYAFIVGNGSDDENASNAMAVDWDGNLHVAGEVKGENFFARESLSPAAVTSYSGSWQLLTSFFGEANTAYLILYGAAFATNANGYRQLYVGGTTVSAGRYSPSYAAVTGEQTRIQGATVYKFTTEGSVYLYARQNSGSNIDVYGWMQVIKLPN